MEWLKSLVTALRQRLDPPDPLPERRLVGRDGFVPPVLIDAGTRTFWARGASSPATLVEAIPPPDAPRPARITELLNAHQAGRSQDAGRPRGNPAFCEALFVELMRAQRYERAFALLSADCQASWGSSDRFAVAQRGGTLRYLRGVTVKEVRHLTEWTDVSRGMTYHHVAELDVEYAFGTEETSVTIPRTIHLVACDGKWRSLCYPDAAEPPAAAAS